MLSIIILVSSIQEDVNGGGNDSSTRINLIKEESFRKLFADAISLEPQESTITYDDIPGSYPYREHAGLIKPSNANGKRKLFLEYIQFLTNYPDIELVVYVGSGPGTLDNYVHNLFPNLKAIMIDPTDHNIYMGSNITLSEKEYRNDDSSSMYTVEEQNKIAYLYDHGKLEYKTPGIDEPKVNLYNPIKDEVVTAKREKTEFNPFANVDNTRNFILNSKYKMFLYQDYFTTDMARFFEKILKGTRCAFISDIRFRGDGRGITESFVHCDLILQYVWTKVINPTYYKLKFRIPFVDDSHSTKERKCPEQLDIYKNGVLTYLPGKIYLQPWAPSSSTETRLVGERDNLGPKGWDATKKYNLKDYEAKMWYYNNIWRPYVRHKNDYLNKTNRVDMCNDCALEVHILKEYKAKINPNFDIEFGIYTLNNVSRIRPLKNKPLHGSFYQPMTVEKYEEYIKEFFGK